MGGRIGLLLHQSSPVKCRRGCARTRDDAAAKKAYTDAIGPACSERFTHHRAREGIVSNFAKVTAIVGTYRKGGAIDSAVDEILAAAKDSGAETSKIYLLDKHIDFCTNCRTCTQQPGPDRGACPIADDLGWILNEIEQSDAIVLASPMNFWTVTAIMKRFIERLVCYAYWPWGAHGPKPRITGGEKRAVVVCTSAAPAILARLMSRMAGLLKTVARLVGAKKVDVLFIGLAAGQPRAEIGIRARAKARRIGRSLAAVRRNP